MNQNSDSFYQKAGAYSKASKASFAIPESVNNMLGSINLTAQTDPKRLQAIKKYKDSRAQPNTINLTSQTEPNRFEPVDVFTINKANKKFGASMDNPETLGFGKNHPDKLENIEESSKGNSFHEDLLKEPFLVIYPLSPLLYIDYLGETKTSKAIRTS